jgi:hypothetical protein
VEIVQLYIKKFIVQIYGIPGICYLSDCIFPLQQCRMEVFSTHIDASAGFFGENLVDAAQAIGGDSEERTKNIFSSMFL